MAEGLQQLFNFTNTNYTSPSSGGNQYFPAMPSLPTPGIVPAAQTGTNFVGTARDSSPTAKSANSQYYAGSTLDPNFTKDFFGWLQSNIGKGATPFNLSAVMPSTGDTTAPGTLTAPNNPITQELMSNFKTGGVMDQMIQTGMPIDQTPAWQAMKDAMQRSISEGSTNLKEQFNFAGGLAGSPMGSAMNDYQAQTAKDLNAQLLQAQTQSLEAARGRQLQASGQEAQVSQYLQSLDQASIDRLLQEFIRTRPEYSPLLNEMFGASTTFPPYLQKAQGQGAGGAAAGDAAQIAMMVAMGA